jgi:SAM-dependent methyltransferase
MRSSRSEPSTAPPAGSFDAPNISATIDERLDDLKATIGPDHPDVALVEGILEEVSEAQFEKLRQLHSGDPGSKKYLDVVYWTYQRLRYVRSLGLAGGPQRAILDIGCGPGHFLKICLFHGHTGIGTDVERPIYRDLSAALGVDRRVVPVAPENPSPDFGQKFDLITAMSVEFHRLTPDGEGSRYWSLDHWKFLLNDLTGRQLNFPGRLYLHLNREIRGGELVQNTALIELCRSAGARVNFTSGQIDFVLDAPIIFA